MNEIQVFAHEQFGKVRTVTIDGEPWFVGKDVCDALAYANSRKALIDHVDDEDKGVTICDTPGGKQEMVIINESGLYSLVFASKLPGAKEFKHWVTSEVLPAIRKHGAYIAGQEVMSDNELLAKALIAANNIINERKKQIVELNTRIEADKPKVLFADAVSVAKTSILIGELAKLLRQNGVETGQKRLFEWLREHGYLIKRRGADWNMPTQRAMEMELFEIKETAVALPDGATCINKTPKVTGKGQIYFVNLFLKGDDSAVA